MEITTYLNRVHIGNALELAEALPSESIHCIITSPPYLGLRDYGLPPFDWQAVEYAPMPGLPPVRVEAWRGCLGLEPDPFMYVGHLVAIFRALRRALRSDGTAWVNLGDSYANSPIGTIVTNNSTLSGSTVYQGNNGISPNLIDKTKMGLKTKDLMSIPWRAALALQADGWWLRSDIPWVKRNPMPGSQQDRPTTSNEYFFLLSKSERYYFDMGAIRKQNQWPDHNRFGNKNAAARLVKELTGNMRPDAPEDTDRVGRAPRESDWFFDSLRAILDGEQQILLNEDGDPLALVINPKPYKAAHFATYPPALIEPCVLASTSERGACSTCGTPWVRVVEKSTELEQGRKVTGLGPKTLDNPMTTNGSGGSTLHHTVKSTTTGFRPACDCPTHDPVPCVVLDPFIGSGTTAQVAIEHRRNWIGFEANPDYAEELVSERLNGTQVRLL